MTAVATGPTPDGPWDLNEHLVAITRAATEAELDWLVNDFIVRTDQTNRTIAAGLCRHFKADRNTWLDDFTQRVRDAAYHLLMELAHEPERLEQMASWRGLLTFRSRSVATAYVDSSEGFNQASGMVGVKRRLREMEKTRAQMYAMLRREPTDEEIVEATNRRMAATRSDYKRQGMECKVEDLRLVAPAENIDDVHPQASPDTVESDSDLHATEAATLIQRSIAACDAESAQLGAIARIWFAPALRDDYDEHPTAAEIAAQVGIQPSTARHKVAQVRQIARQVARDQYGIHRHRDSA